MHDNLENWWQYFGKFWLVSLLSLYNTCVVFILSRNSSSTHYQQTWQCWMHCLKHPDTSSMLKLSELELCQVTLTGVAAISGLHTSLSAFTFYPHNRQIKVSLQTITKSVSSLCVIFSEVRTCRMLVQRCPDLRSHMWLHGATELGSTFFALSRKQGVSWWGIVSDMSRQPWLWGESGKKEAGDHDMWRRLKQNTFWQVKSPWKDHLPFSWSIVQKEHFIKLSISWFSWTLYFS